jgi:hypothetical protein
MSFGFQASTNKVLGHTDAPVRYATSPQQNAPASSAEHRLAVRELAGLHSTYEMAGPIMEDLYPLEWGAMRRSIGSFTVFGRENEPARHRRRTQRTGHPDRAR